MGGVQARDVGGRKHAPLGPAECVVQCNPRLDLLATFSSSAISGLSPPPMGLLSILHSPAQKPLPGSLPGLTWVGFGGVPCAV